MSWWMRTGSRSRSRRGAVLRPPYTRRCAPRRRPCGCAVRAISCSRTDVLAHAEVRLPCESNASPARPLCGSRPRLEEAIRRTSSALPSPWYRSAESRARRQVDEVGMHGHGPSCRSLVKGRELVGLASPSVLRGCNAIMLGHFCSPWPKVRMVSITSTATRIEATRSDGRCPASAKR